MLTKYYLTKMENRLIEDILFELKNKTISKETADSLRINLHQEILWAKKELSKRKNDKEVTK